MSYVETETPAPELPTPSETTMAMFDARMAETPETVAAFTLGCTTMVERTEAIRSEGYDDGYAEALEEVADVVRAADALLAATHPWEGQLGELDDGHVVERIEALRDELASWRRVRGDR